MAELLLTPGNTGPVNAGEQLVVSRLVNELPDNFVVVPNLEVPVGGGDFAEIDALVIGNDVAWVIEIKDHTPDVEILQHSYLVGGMPRSPHAVKATRRKCQKLHTRLSPISFDLGRVWFQPLIVLAKQPEALSVAESMKDFVRVVDQAISLIKDPSQIGLYRDPITSLARTQLRKLLAEEAGPKPPRFESDMFIGTQLIARTQDWEMWVADHRVFNESVQLHIRRISNELPPEEQLLRKEKAFRPAILGKRVSGHINVAAPKDPFFTDDGSAVLVIPAHTFPGIDESFNSDTLDDEAKRKLLLGVARTVHFCHARKIALRSLSPDTVLVRTNGAPLLTGFLYAHTGPEDKLSDTPINWGTVLDESWQSPEHLAGTTVSFPADRWFVGQLATALFNGNLPDDILAAVEALLLEDPDQRANSLDPLIKSLTPPASASPSPTVITPAENVVYGERYKLVSKLGEGGMAQVWKATDLIQDVDVAVKVLNEDAELGDLQSECKMLQAINNDGVVKIRDATSMNGRFLIVMELLEGHPLETLKLGDPISESEAVQIGLRLLTTLASFHPDTSQQWESFDSGSDTEANNYSLARAQPGKLVHRDITPRNVIMVQDRGPVLIDFGFAASGEAGAVGGSPAYQPPDAIPGSAMPDVDLYAVAVIMCELLGGKLPTPQQARKSILLPADISPGLAKILQRATHPNGSERFRSASELIAELVGLGFPEVEIPAPSIDVVDTQAAIWDAVRNHDFEQARNLCPSTWTSVLERIDELELLLETISTEDALIEAAGYRLIYRGARTSAEETDTDGTIVSPVEISDYVVEGPGGDTLELHTFSGTAPDQDGFMRLWVNSGHAFEATGPLRLLAGGALRMSRLKLDDIYIALELAMAVESGGKGRSKKRVSADELDIATGIDVAEVLKQHGAAEYGTRGEVFRDTSNRKNYLCVTFPPSCWHGAAVAYFVTRVLPLA